MSGGSGAHRRDATTPGRPRGLLDHEGFAGPLVPGVVAGHDAEVEPPLALGDLERGGREVVGRLVAQQGRPRAVGELAVDLQLDGQLVGADRAPVGVDLGIGVSSGSGVKSGSGSDIVPEPSSSAWEHIQRS